MAFQLSQVSASKSSRPSSVDAQLSPALRIGTPPTV
ncbi:Uncharacterised protein [Mycobacteroides abscessus]|nr:Uncharacterised protein [Mycobacteroides abscessus]